jgi:hypothetical protein
MSLNVSEHVSSLYIMLLSVSVLLLLLLLVCCLGILLVKKVLFILQPFFFCCIESFDELTCFFAFSFDELMFS